MPHRIGELYLAALLHDIGKMFGKLDSGQTLPDAQLIEDWKTAHCPAGCTRFGRNRCSFHPMIHHARGAAFLLQGGLPPALRHIAALVLCHHGIREDNQCPDGLTPLSAMTGCTYDAARKRLEVAGEVRDLLAILKTADGMSGSVARVGAGAKIDVRDRGVLCSPYWPVVSGQFEERHLRLPGAGLGPRGWLTGDPQFLVTLVKNTDFFSEDWELLRSSLRDYVGTTVEDRERAPDVPLWTHVSVTAALALCYYVRREPVPTVPDDGTPVPSGLTVACLTFTETHRLVDLPSDGALKQLRGRAAFLSLLTAGFARRVLGALNLPPECLILRWDAGCFLLLPDSAAEELTTAAANLVREAGRLPGFVRPRVVRAPLYVRKEGPELRLLLQEGMRETWRVAAYGHVEAPDVELVTSGGPVAGPRLAPAFRCRVCGEPRREAVGLCPSCQELETLGVRINRRKLENVGLHLRRDGFPAPAYTLEHLGVVAAPGGWAWRPPVGPGSPQQKLDREADKDRPKEKIGVTLVRCEAVARLLAQLEKEDLSPGRVAQCHRLADVLFESLHREDEDVWVLRWVPHEGLLLGRAEETLRVVKELPALCRGILGFEPRELGLKVALGICPLDAPWREVAEALRVMIETAARTSEDFIHLADGTPFDPATTVELLEAAREYGADGKFALEVLEVALSRGRRVAGFDLVAASTTLMMTRARATGRRREALDKVAKVVGRERDREFVATLRGTVSSERDLLDWLQWYSGEDNHPFRRREGPAESLLASLALARHLLEA